MESKVSYTPEEWMALTDAERRAYYRTLPDLTLDDLPEEMRDATIAGIERTRATYGL